MVDTMDRVVDTFLKDTMDMVVDTFHMADCKLGHWGGYSKFCNVRRRHNTVLARHRVSGTSRRFVNFAECLSVN